MKYWILAIFGVLFFSFAVYYRIHPLTSKVRIGDEILYIDVAITEEQKQRGLSGRQSLASNEGMLFSYDHKEQYNFWMRGMVIPLDFLWIDGSTVVDISKYVPPPKANEKPIIVKPKVSVDKVLEVKAGTADRLGIKIGDPVQFLDR